MQLQWEESLLLKEESEIRGHFQNDRRKLFILAKGFDPRMCRGLRCFMQFAPDMHVALVNYSETPKSASRTYASDSHVNMQEFAKISKAENVDEIVFSMWKEEGGRKTSLVKQNLGKYFTKEYLEPYDEIIVDMSAMPRSIFTVLIKILHKRRGDRHLSILVCENSMFDDSITPTNYFEDAGFLNGIGAYTIGSESDNDKRTVWFPMLGTGAEENIKKIADFLRPDEICPIIPFPSIDAARGDRILKRYENILFRSLEVEKKNIIYVSEFNPISVYVKLCTSVFYFAEALSTLNRGNNPRLTKFVFSMQSSKLMEVGVLLTVMELIHNEYKAGIAVVENEGYKMDKECYCEDLNKLYCLCLDDSIYD